MIPEARATCPRCRRPASVCYCAHLPSLSTRTRVVVLQHPREQHMAIGTARMAHLSLPNSTLRVGLDFSRDEVIQAELRAERPTYVVFPSERAIDAADLPRDRDLTLVVIDGTWWQAQKLLKLNPAIRALPHVAFSPQRPSQYQIRRQPAQHCVSTIEALAEVLQLLEPDGGPFERLLDPFLAMVARQQEFAVDIKSARHRKLDADSYRLRPEPTLGQRLDVPWERIVCVQGDANAWPIHHPDRAAPETVHWTAHRPASGESYEAIVRPSRRLAPSTASHLGLSTAQLEGGLDRAAWRASWEAFVRPDDVIVEWGTFTGKLSFGHELPRPSRRIDLRSEALQHLRRPVGTVEECAELLGIEAPALPVGGRAGRRLSSLVANLQALWSLPRQKLAPRRPSNG